MTQPNPPTPKNYPKLVGWVGLSRFWQVGGLVAHPETYEFFFTRVVLLPLHLSYWMGFYIKI